MNISYFTRQLDLANPDLLTKDIGIIGIGSIGSWTAYALLKMGCQKVSVYDFDRVSEENIGSQIYTSLDIGTLKTHALQEKMSLLTESRIEIIETRIDEEHMPSGLLTHDIVILAVDNIETRKIVFDALLAKVWAGVLIDARMAGNALEIYTIPFTDRAKVEHYRTRLFPASEAEAVRCSARSVVYNVFIVAGLIADIVAQLSRNEMPPQELIMDLQNYTFYGGLQ